MRKNKLRDVLHKLMTKREETERRVQSLQERRRNIQGKAANATERVTALIRDLRRRLGDLEKRVLSDISGQAERLSLSLDELIQQLEIKKDELSRKMEDIEELCNMADPLTVLQRSDTGDLCDVKDGDDEDRERHDRLLHDGWDLDVAAISHTLHTGLSNIMSGVNIQKRPGTHVYPHCSTKKSHLTAELSQPYGHHRPNVQRCQTRGPNIQAAQQTSGLSGVIMGRLGFTDILLDVSTAGNYLAISDDRKTVLHSSHLNRPETPKRFQCRRVLSSQSFSSGRRYWEVDVGESKDWIVGVSYPSIDRRGEQSVIGHNKKSWGLERLGGNQYSVRHDSIEIRLPDGVSSTRVRIFVDYEAGRISFYDVCDPIRLLHTFTEPLHAALWVWRGLLKISGENQM